MSAPVDWKDEIVRLVYIKQQIAELDQAGLYPHRLPSVAATHTQIHECQTFLGFALDPDYVRFLLCANGWDGFLQDMDLFGTMDLMGSARYHNASVILDVHDHQYYRDIGLTRNDIIPIGKSVGDSDIYGMTKHHQSENATFYWFHSADIESFLSFFEFYLAMVEYNLLVLKLEEEAQATGQSGLMIEPRDPQKT
jgi:hypothetical protein